MDSPQSEHGVPTLARPQTPPSKPVGASLDPATIPRLGTSMSSHDRLIPDDSALETIPMPILQPAEPLSVATEPPSTSRTTLLHLPEEIQQRILDMMMGELQAPSAATTTPTESNRVLRNWNNVMRHPRRRQLTDLTLVCERWRCLVQGRIYRHLKIQGTIEAINEVYAWFLSYPHLAQYVRHIEFWVPIWQRRGGPRDIKDPASTTLIDMAVDYEPRPSVHFGAPRTNLLPVEPISQAYCLSSQNSTLDELFECVADLFRSACILTIEGGHCKRPPMIELFRHRPAECSTLAELPRVQTLVMRGAWNIMRQASHFGLIAEALPNLTEWHCAYTKPKAGGYHAMYDIVRHMPPTIARLNISLDGFYGQKTISTAKAMDIMESHHLCSALGAILPRFEAVTLSGRFCSVLFAHALQAASNFREVRLKSMDLIIKNCCRPLDQWNDGAAYNNWGFICAFEQLVVAATRALRLYPALNFLRIRFVDLDAPCPLLNPYFQLVRGECSGIWNDEILAYVAQARPAVAPIDLADSFSATGPPKHSSEYPLRRPRSIKVSTYAAFSEAALI